MPVIPRACLFAPCLIAAGCASYSPSVQELEERGKTAFAGVEIIASETGVVTIDAPVTPGLGAMVALALLLLGAGALISIPIARGDERLVWPTRLFILVMAGLWLYVFWMSVSHYLVDRHTVIDVSRRRVEIDRTYLFGSSEESLSFDAVRDLRVVWLQGRGSRLYTLRLRTQDDEIWLLTHLGDGGSLAASEALRDYLAARLQCPTAESVGRLFPR